MKTSLALFAALVVAAPLAAQDAPAGKAVGAYTPASCGEPGLALEKASFDLSVAAAPSRVRLIYAGCAKKGRNDRLPGRIERYYQGTDGYSLTVVTANEDTGAKISDALVAQNKKSIAVFSGLDNTMLAYNAVVVGDGLMLTTAEAEHRLDKCQASLPKPVYGPNLLWLLTPTKAFYYHEDCDICAQLDSCDLKTGAIKEEITAHSVSCEEAKAKTKGEPIIFQGCGR